MPRHPSQQPTEVELEILGILWKEGTASAREVHDQLSKIRDTNYSTTVKMLAVMADKGLVKRDETSRPIQFRTAKSKQKTQSGILKNLIRKAYNGSASSLVMQALSSQKASKEELQQIRDLLDQLDEKDGDSP